MKSVPSEGMPVRRIHTKGNLYIKFEIKFPENKWLEENKYRLLEQLLPKRTPQNIPAGAVVDEVMLNNMTEQDQRSRASGGRNGAGHHHHHMHDDEDDDHAQPGVQCAQQ